MKITNVIKGKIKQHLINLRLLAYLNKDIKNEPEKREEIQLIIPINCSLFIPYVNFVSRNSLLGLLTFAENAALEFLSECDHYSLLMGQPFRVIHNASMICQV